MNNRTRRHHCTALTSREELLEFLQKSSSPLKETQIARHFHHTSTAERAALHGRLEAMIRDGQIIRNQNSTYGLLSKTDLITGCVQNGREGIGQLECFENGKTYFLSHAQMHYLVQGDRIVARLGGEDLQGRHFATHIKFLSRPTIVGHLQRQRDATLVIPLKRQITSAIRISKCTKKYPDNALVSVQLAPLPNTRLQGKIVTVFTDRYSADAEIAIALHHYAIPHHWDDVVIEAARKLPKRVRKSDLAQRRDLRELPFCTIDGSDARDFDDAVYAEKEGKHFRLWVAIADVGHYVTPDSALDREAAARGNSVYFPRYVAPMLPSALSEGLCSLKPNVERLALVCELVIKTHGILAEYAFYPAVIHSQARLTYDQVAMLLTAPDPEVQSSVTDDVRNSLQTLFNLYQMLAQARRRRGAIELETPEIHVLLGRLGMVKGIEARYRNDAHRLIEEMMLLANQAAADALQRHHPAALYRTHDAPNTDRIQTLIELLQAFQIRIRPQHLQTPQQFSQLLLRLQQHPLAEYLQIAVLRTMKQARYTPQPGMHFGLNYSLYTHFTSPIRRYADLLTHRALRTALDAAGGILCKSTPTTQKKPIAPGTALQRLGVHLSLTERRADAATREVIETLKCIHIRNALGDIFEATVTHIVSFGLFATLTGQHIEGLIHVNALHNDYYHFDAQRMQLIGRHTKTCYGLGKVLRVRLAKVDVDTRRVDLVLA